MKRISFDFDGVLTKVKYQNLAKKLLNKGNHIYIITSRDKDENRVDNEIIYEIADEIGIPTGNIIFTAYYPKCNFMEPNNYVAEWINFHYDDDELEIELIAEHCMRCKGKLAK